MGSPVYANEAARDAAIPAPSEGMQCYLTAPTIPAATGVSTFLPPGITTIYDGSAWVCVTEISAANDAVNTTTSSTSYVTTLTNDGTAISVTLVTGTRALVSMTMEMNSGASNEIFLSVSVSGATTVAAADTRAAKFISNVNYFGNNAIARTFVFPSLTAGTNTFTLNYRTTAGTSGMYKRSLIVKGIA
jgi:hypothetical protein